MQNGESETLVRRRVAGPRDELGSAGWLPTCSTCGQRGEVDEIDLLIGQVTMTCSPCGTAWTEAVSGALRVSVSVPALSRTPDFTLYQRLEEPERASVMVRVLCGLVALEEEASAPV